MTLRTVLVLGRDGRPQQLQAGDSINLPGGNLMSQTASGALIAGAPVCNSGSPDTVVGAQATTAATALTVGLCTAAIAGSAVGAVQSSGLLTLTTTQWDAAFGTTGGLTPGTTYYLSPATAGMGQAAVPATPGQFVTILGVALSTTDLLITISEPAEL